MPRVDASEMLLPSERPTPVNACQVHIAQSRHAARTISDLAIPTRERSEAHYLARASAEYRFIAVESPLIAKGVLVYALVGRAIEKGDTNAKRAEHTGQHGFGVLGRLLK